MTLPHFLIVGAMKAGTTSLYDELANMPGIFMSPEKEPEDLAFPDIEQRRGLVRYESKFSGAKPEDRIGEASTAYTKYPQFKDAPRRALEILGPDIKLIYMVRHPVSRMISHYTHVWGDGRETRDIDTALVEDPLYEHFSRYGEQIDRWREYYSDDQILLVSFEEFTTTPSVTLRAVRQFLGLDGEYAPANAHRNSGKDRHVFGQRSLARAIIKSPLYLRYIKPVAPSHLREALKRRLSRAPKPQLQSLSPAVERVLTERFGSDWLAGKLITQRLTGSMTLREFKGG